MPDQNNPAQAARPSEWPETKSCDWSDLMIGRRPNRWSRSLRDLPARYAAKKASDLRELLPLIIGVTGHRDLPPEDRPALKKAMAAVFTDLRRRCPHTPLMLLSPLAEGADRLAAEVFLEFFGNHNVGGRFCPYPAEPLKHHCGHGGALPLRGLVAPLPQEPALYRQSFMNNDPQFDSLLEQAEKVFVVPEPDLPPGVAENYRLDFRRPPECYDALGAYLTTHCHVLLAVWDKTPSTEPGGTAQVVYRQLTGKANLYPDLENDLVPAEGGSVVHIWSRRRAAAAGGELRLEAKEPGTLEFLYPAAQEDEPDLLRQTLDRLEEYNRNILRLDSRFIKQDLWPETERAALSDSQQRILKLQSQTSALADTWAARLRLRLKLLFAGGGLAMLSFQAYRLARFNFPNAALWPFIFISGLAALAVLVSYGQAQLGGWQNKHLSYRGLAEAWRVLFYWRGGGIGRSVAEQSFAGEYLEDFGETRWLRLALAYTEIGPDDQAGFGGFSLPEIKERWLTPQHTFFSQKSVQNQTKKESCLWPAIISLALGSVWFIFGKFLRDIAGDQNQTLLISILSLIIIAAGLEAYNRLSRQVGDHKKWLAFILLGSGLTSGLVIFPQVPLSASMSLTLSVLGIAFLGGGGLLVGYLKLSAFSENADRYREGKKLFSAALHLLDGHKWPTEQVLISVGQKALEENSSWLRQHLDRPINLPLS